MSLSGPVFDIEEYKKIRDLAFSKLEIPLRKEAACENVQYLDFSVWRTRDAFAYFNKLATSFGETSYYVLDVLMAADEPNAEGMIRDAGVSPLLRIETTIAPKEYYRLCTAAFDIPEDYQTFRPFGRVLTQDCLDFDVTDEYAIFSPTWSWAVHGDDDADVAKIWSINALPVPETAADLAVKSRFAFLE